MSENPEELQQRIAAYIDGELSSSEAARFEVYLANTDPKLADQIIGMLADKVQLRALPKPQSPADLPARIMEQIERATLLHDVENLSAPRRPWWQTRIAIAASLFLVLGGFAVFMASSVLRPRGNGPWNTAMDRSAASSDRTTIAMNKASVVEAPAQAINQTLDTPIARGSSTLADAASPALAKAGESSPSAAKIIAEAPIIPSVGKNERVAETQLALGGAARQPEQQVAQNESIAGSAPPATTPPEAAFARGFGGGAAGAAGGRGGLGGGGGGTERSNEIAAPPALTVAPAARQSALAENKTQLPTADNTSRAFAALGRSPASTPVIVTFVAQDDQEFLRLNAALNNLSRQTAGNMPAANTQASSANADQVPISPQRDKDSTFFHMALRAGQFDELAKGFRVAVMARGEDTYLFRTSGDQTPITADTAARADILRRAGIENNSVTPSGQNANLNGTQAGASLQSDLIDCIITVEHAPSPNSQVK